MSSSKTTAGKIYYRIGEVASLLGVKPHVLRSWETELDVVEPARTGSKRRLYRQRDIEILRQVKHLLHDEGLTIEDVRRRLATSRTVPSSDRKLRAVLARVKKDLEALLLLLS